MGTRITVQSWDDDPASDGIDVLRRTLYMVDELRSAGLAVRVTGNLDIQARVPDPTPVDSAAADATPSPAG